MALARGSGNPVQKARQRPLKRVPLARFKRPSAGETLGQPQITGITGLVAGEIPLGFNPALDPFMRLNADQRRALRERRISVARFHVRKADELAFIRNAQSRSHVAGKLVGYHTDQGGLQTGRSLRPLDFVDVVHQPQVFFGQRSLGFDALRGVCRPFAQHRRKLMQQFLG